jgi:hypothetical protein
MARTTEENAYHEEDAMTIRVAAIEVNYADAQDGESARVENPRHLIGSCHLAACKTILDVVGDLFADVCQVEEFFLDDGIFGLFGKLSIRGRLLPEIVVPLHTYLPRND